LFLDVGDKILAEFFAFGNHVCIGTSNVKEHVLLRLLVRSSLVVARAAAFDLNTATSLMLDVFDVGSTMSYDLRAQVEARGRIQIYRNLFL
jgi:putative ubiquitin-RnfH superfamily antitoxin RatB of RatAB toxin-antitoxin module